MNRRLRARRLLAAMALAAAALSPAASGAAASTARPHAAGRAVAEDEAPVPEEEYEELAGSVPGAGRERPGRPAAEPAAEPADPDGAVLASRPYPVRRHPRPVGPPPARPSHRPPHSVTAFSTEPNERAADLAAHLLPLGTGFALMGLGLGYLGVRLRRGG
ncbi:hypothetical protein AB0953_01415 [Streptomyces sp. NPDC046866]|uniref:hypothetical protein n=1 Tax=Streptomyces sp. NPDC046866 TaxID=3154921 RepID=UPI00345499D4